MSVNHTRTAAEPDTAPEVAPQTEHGSGRDSRQTRHGPIAQLLIALSPLSAILLAYPIAQWITAPLASGERDTTRLGAVLHVLEPARADEWLLGSIPTIWLQERLVSGPPQWYDALAALIYITHFLAIPLVTGAAWFSLRNRFRQWITSVLCMSLLGIAAYAAYPAAPPWLAAEQGAIGNVERISHTGWDVLHLEPMGRLTGLLQSGSNPIAAMPSLHAGAALLIALFLWRSVSLLAKSALAVYVCAMAVTLVYTGEHYVSDVFAGWFLATMAHLIAPPGGKRWNRRQRYQSTFPRTAPAP